MMISYVLKLRKAISVNSTALVVALNKTRSKTCFNCFIRNTKLIQH